MTSSLLIFKYYSYKIRYKQTKTYVISIHAKLNVPWNLLKA